MTGRISSKSTNAFTACWVISLPVLTLLTNTSWYAASPLAGGNRSLTTFWALASSLALLTALCLGVRWALGPQKFITSATFYRTTVISSVLGVITAAPMAIAILVLAGDADSGKDPGAIPGTGSAYVLSAFAMPAAFTTVLVAIAIFALTDTKRRQIQGTTTTTVIACSLILGLGACLLSAGQTAALGPTSAPSPKIQPAPIATPSSTPDSNALVLPAECPEVKASSVQALRIPAGGVESMVTSVLNTFSTWLSSGSELMRLPEWRKAPAHCTALLASAYGNAYSSSIFTDQTGPAWRQYFNGQVALNAKLLEALRTANPKDDGQKPASYQLDKVIDTSSNRSGNYLKFDATLVSTATVDWQNSDKKARWYVQLIPWEDFYIIDYVEAL